MRLSAIVPVHDNAGFLDECLRALASSAGPDAEIVVVDDASTDGSAAIAERTGIRVLRLPRNVGAAAARNHGVRHTTGDVLVFVDSDVVIAPDTIRRMVGVLAAHPDVGAVFGSYDATPRAPGLVSQFRNLLHHFVHQEGDPEASTFWAGCGAVRRSAFEEVGGFDEGVHARAIEDIELGYRLRAAGHRILLDRNLLGTHLKRWTLGSMIRTDVQLRAIPWARLLLSRSTPFDHLNLKAEQRLSVAAAMIVAASLTLAPIAPALLAFGLVAMLVLAIANRRFLAFCVRERGAAFAAGAAPLLFVHYLGSGLAYLWARGEHALGRRPAPARWA